MACFRLVRLMTGTSSGSRPASIAGLSMRRSAITRTRWSSSFFASNPVASWKSSRNHSAGTSILRCGIAGSLAFDGLAVNFNLRDVGPSAGTVSAARQKVGKADLVDLAQIRTVRPIPRGDDPGDVQLAPPHIRNREFIFVPVDRGAVGVVSHQPGPVGELQNRVDLVKSGHLRDPSDHGESREVDVVVFVPEHRGADLLAKSRPKVEGIAFALRGAGKLNIPGARAV